MTEFTYIRFTKLNKVSSEKRPSFFQEFRSSKILFENSITWNVKRGNNTYKYRKHNCRVPGVFTQSRDMVLLQYYLQIES